MTAPDPVTVTAPDGTRLVVGGATVEEQQQIIADLQLLGQLLELHQANLAILLNPLAAHATIDANQAWRDSPRAAQVLALEGELTSNLLRNIVQDLINQSQRQARQLNALWRLALAATSPELLEEIDPA